MPLIDCRVFGKALNSLSIALSIYFRERSRIFKIISMVEDKSGFNL